MPERKKVKIDEKEKKEPKKLPLEQLILDKATFKYRLVALAAEWAKDLKKSEEFRHLTQNELLDKALEDVITGVVTWDTLRTAKSNGDQTPSEAPQAGDDGKKSKKKED